MVEDGPDRTAASATVNRRRVLSMVGGAAATVVGVGAFSTSAAAWTRLGADFKGCSEVWILVSEEDLTLCDRTGDCDVLTVSVIVDTGREALCRTIDITEDAATTIPGQHGDTPLVKYSVDDGEKILGIVGNSPAGIPLSCELIRNDHPCTQTPDTHSLRDALCVQQIHPCNPGASGDGGTDSSDGDDRRGPGHDDGGPPPGGRDDEDEDDGPPGRGRGRGDDDHGRGPPGREDDDERGRGGGPPDRGRGNGDDRHDRGNDHHDRDGEDDDHWRSFGRYFSGFGSDG